MIDPRGHAGLGLCPVLMVWYRSKVITNFRSDFQPISTSQKWANIFGQSFGPLIQFLESIVNKRHQYQSSHSRLQGSLLVPYV